MWDERIIGAIRRREEEAISQVMTRYSRLLWSVAGAVLKNAPEQDIEECVADAFIYLWQHPEQYDPQRGTLKSWLAMVAKSRALDRVRKLSRRRELSLEEGFGPEPEEEPELWTGGMEELLEGLNEEDRELFRRRYGEEQKPGEIAREMGLPVKLVENRLYRGRQKLRRRLEREEDAG